MAMCHKTDESHIVLKKRNIHLLKNIHNLLSFMDILNTGNGKPYVLRDLLRWQTYK